MKLFRFVLALALSLSSIPAWADFAAAAQAYRQHQYVQAYKAFMHLARNGNARAQTVVALMNKYGESVPQNSEVAFAWYMKAAKQGYGPAMFEVGVMYLEGNGVDGNHDAAVEWLKKAAKAGFERAAPKLAQLGALPAKPPAGDDDARGPKTWNLRLPNRIRDMPAPMTRVPPDATWRVLLGILDTRVGAGRLWDALVDHAPDIFRNVNPIISLNGEGPQRSYEVMTGPFDGLAAAMEFCRQLQSEVRTYCQPVTR